MLRDDFFYARIPIFYCPKEKPYLRQTYLLSNFLVGAIGNSCRLIFLLIIGDISQHPGFIIWLWSSVSRGEDPLIYSEVDEEEDDYSDCEGRYVAAKTPVFWDMDG
ncbi:hypothetical protein Bca4012_031082 [Brassica carinata]